MTMGLELQARFGHEPGDPQEGGDLAGAGVYIGNSDGRRVWVQPGAAELCLDQDCGAVRGGTACKEDRGYDPDNRIDGGADAEGGRDYQERSVGNPDDSGEKRGRRGCCTDEEP